MHHWKAPAKSFLDGFWFAAHRFLAKMLLPIVPIQRPRMNRYLYIRSYYMGGLTIAQKAIIM